MDKKKVIKAACSGKGGKADEDNKKAIDANIMNTIRESNSLKGKPMYNNLKDTTPYNPGAEKNPGSGRKMLDFAADVIANPINLLQTNSKKGIIKKGIQKASEKTNKKDVPSTTTPKYNNSNVNQKFNA